ncbi:MAG: hypothetical protein AAF617_01720 [Bacteroidota bacterium]
MSPEALDTLFKAPKNEDTGWYTLDKFGQKIWDAEKVRLFWKEFEDRKIQQEDYIFDGFVFPVFRKKRNVYYFSSKLEFKKKVFFKNVTFVEAAHFSNVTQFLDDVSMEFVNFQDELDFHGVRFFGSVYIGNTHIEKDVDFVSTQFKYLTLYNFTCNGDLDFRNARITESSTFSKVTLHKAFLLNTTSINEQFHIKQSVFNDLVSLKETTILNDFHITNCNFTGTFNTVESRFGSLQLSDTIFDAQFKMLKCTLGFAIIEDTIFDNFSLSQLNFEEPTLYPVTIGFTNIDFPNKSKFERINLTDITFNFCELSTINFRNCIWNIKNRIILEEESLNLLDSENHYRQLKSGFKSSNHWELSGNAYVSEMEMRKLRLYKEKRYVSWFIYWFYDKFGSYTQNFLRPLYIFLILSFFLFPLIYLLIDSALFAQFSLEQLSESYEKSIAAAFPFLKSDLLKDTNWWLKSFQVFFSGILLTFFILAVRKRFKQ